MTEANFDPITEVSTCCRARVSAGDDGFYCKKCYGSVQPLSETIGLTVDPELMKPAKRSVDEAS